MNTDKLTKITDILTAWGVPMLTGWRALLRCAVVAAQHEAWGEPWTPMGVGQEVSALMGKNQWTLWQSMRNALRKSRCAPRSVAAAIKLLVERVVA